MKRSQTTDAPRETPPVFLWLGRQCASCKKWQLWSYQLVLKINVG